jgi:hypothetical protein
MYCCLIDDKDDEKWFMGIIFFINFCIILNLKVHMMVTFMNLILDLYQKNTKKVINVFNVFNK